MNQPVDDPDELHDLASTAIGIAVESIPPRGPFAPFALIQDESGVALHRMVSDRLEVSLEQARTLVASSAPTRAAIVFDGFTSFTGTRLDSVLVEAYESGAAGGIVVAQPYRRTGLMKKRVETVGKGAVIQRGSTPLFASAPR